MTFEEHLNSRPGGAKGFIKGLRLHAKKLMHGHMIEGSSDEDLAQLALLKGFQKFEKYYNPKWSFSTWMYHIVQNEIIRVARNYKRHLRLLNPVFIDDHVLNLDTMERHQYDIPTLNPEKSLHAKLDVRHALANMTPVQKRDLNFFLANERRASDLKYREKSKAKKTPQDMEIHRIGGKKGACAYHYIRQGKPCICGSHV